MAAFRHFANENFKYIFSMKILLFQFYLNVFLWVYVLYAIIGLCNDLVPGSQQTII